MQRELVVGDKSPLFKPKLQKLAVAAERAHQRAYQCAARSVENMVRAGQALRKFRDLADDKEWEELIVHKFDGSERTVQRYMYLAKHWSLLEASAPPEVLTSQRKALQLIRTLLYGEGTASQVAGTRRKRRAAAAIDVPPAAATTDANRSAQPTAEVSATSGEGEDERHIAVERMYDHIQRVLAELTEELTLLAPPHHLVRHALDAIHRARHHLARRGRTFFHAPTTAGDGAECTNSTAPTARLSSEADAGDPNGDW